MLNIKSIEQGALSLLRTLESEIAARPEAQQAATELKQSIADAKTAALETAQPLVASEVTKLLTPVLGAESAEIAGQLASQALADNVDKL